jgi:hypothetical protein
MIVPLTPREIRLVMRWKPRAFWPDEQRVLNKLEAALVQEAEPDLSRLQVQVIRGWAEENLGGSYGGGEVGNPEEVAVLRKLQEALGE